MEIRNSTNRQLTLYLADKNQEEPEAVKILLVGESFEIDRNMPDIISIQEQ